MFKFQRLKNEIIKYSIKKNLDQTTYVTIVYCNMRLNAEMHFIRVIYLRCSTGYQKCI